MEQYTQRNSSDINQWDEAYKWEIFPKLNALLAGYKSVTAENLLKIMTALKQHNPQQGSFAHWIEMDNLNVLTSHSNGWQVIAPLWSATPATIDTVIETVDTTD